MVSRYPLIERSDGIDQRKPEQTTLFSNSARLKERIASEWLGCDDLNVMRKARSRVHPAWISKFSAQFAILKLSPGGRGFERSQGCERRTAGALEKTKGLRHGQTHGRHSSRSRDPLVRSIGNRQARIQDKALHQPRVRKCMHSPSAPTIVIIRPR
jgi:hypothetical protein